MFEDNTCQDCLNAGNGMCPDCNGTGLEQNVFEALADAIGDESQNCSTCNGTGECQSCSGKGYV